MAEFDNGGGNILKIAPRPKCTLAYRKLIAEFVCEIFQISMRLEAPLNGIDI